VLAVTCAMAAAFVVAAAAPADAHALLLRSEPAGNATLKTSPPVVRLHYSEPVEVQFGAVRLVDANNKLVASGPLRLADGSREVDLPVRPVEDGTYSLLWQVVSADGHPTHGFFTFYVGAPSAISALPVNGPTGPQQTLVWLFGLVRFTWFTAFVLLVGAVCARAWVWAPSLRATAPQGGTAQERAAGSAESPPVTFRRRFAVLLPAAWGVLAVAAVLVLIFQAATVSGQSFLSSLRPSVLGDLLRTRFGQGWLIEMAFVALGAAPVVALARRPRLLGISSRRWQLVGAVCAVGLAAAVAVNGHARTDPHPPLSVVLVAAHLLAAAVWTGGLVALVLLAAPGWRSLPDTRRAWQLRPALVGQVVVRFTRVALLSVAVVVASGTVAAVGEVETAHALVGTSYGRVILAKVALLLVALAFGLRHWRRTPSRLGGPDARAEVRTFETTSAAEAAVLGVTVLLAAILVALTPGRSVAAGAGGPLDVQKRAGPYTVEVTVDPRISGPNEVHVTFVDRSSGVLAQDVATADAQLTSPAGRPVPLSLDVFTPGHFVGQPTLPSAGRYRLVIRGNGAVAAFRFSVGGANAASR